jgi:hypothetical protein
VSKPHTLREGIYPLQGIIHTHEGVYTFLYVERLGNRCIGFSVQNAFFLLRIMSLVCTDSAPIVFIGAGFRRFKAFLGSVEPF